MSKYYVVSSDILPDVLEKVIEARNLLQSGKVKRISEAVKAVGVSRGTYYKYKDAVFSFNDETSRRRAVITMIISQEAGSLSKVLNLVASKNGNILAINQTIPINGIHTLSLTLDITDMDVTIDVFLHLLSNLDVIDKVDLVAVE
ncbi:MAG: ACT domain-containing protein [Absicoccus sp.]|uniref:ACT domain-containing protein n=1 Tax=Absicoccus sp. TaxID=2718527 RepID=UPI002A757154|nr:ACT domain-containing protein [Absicoccus sp.]MDY3036120.1 ACT domain-containing protein [Absicoccus sp.]